jgi:hypothetical protein
VIERLFLGLQVVEISQPLQIRPEVGGRQRTLKASPTCGLSIIGTSQRFENVDPGVFPFEVRPIPAAVAAPMLGRLDRLPRLPRTAGRKEAPRDFRGDFWHFSSFFLVLFDEGIDIAQRVGDFC